MLFHVYLLNTIENEMVSEEGDYDEE